LSSNPRPSTGNVAPARASAFAESIASMVLVIPP